MRSDTTAGRGTWAGPLVWLAVLLAVLALALSYFGRAVLEPQQFANRAVAALKDPAVQADVADHLTNAVVKHAGDLAAVRPLVRATTGAVVSSGAFSGLFRRATLQLHAALVSGHGSSLLLTVADANVLLQGALRRFAPDAARRTESVRLEQLGTLHPGGAVLDVVRFARGIYTAAWVLAAVAVLLALLGFRLSADRRRTAEQLGFRLALGGLTLAALYAVGDEVAAHVAPPGRSAAVAAIWRAFGHGLFTQALILASTGAIVAAVAAAGERTPLGLFAAGESLPARARLGRSLLILATGVVVVLEPGAAATVAVSAAGVYLVYRGLRGVIGVVAGSGAMRRVLRRPSGPTVVRVAAAALAIAAVVAAVAIISTGGEDGAGPFTPVTCNGYAQLCDRPLNDVAFAATHNSMASVSIPTWLFGQQDGTIAEQLGDGIRGFLIDSYYGFPVRGGIRTDLSSVPKRDAAVQEIGEPAVKAAERIRSRIGDQKLGPRQIYLCHTFCELGSVTLSSTLAEIHSFLVRNPGAVIIIINQDEGVAPADIERAFAKAGLLDLVYRGPFGPFPTLREMIDSGQRVLVMAENDAGNIPWYQLAYKSLLQETPFRFTNTAQLTDPSQLDKSCRPNRGPESAPLFLLNHWVDTTPVPRASNAKIVNARSALLRRARTCERIRHRLPNLVAVDFYRLGDVSAVVRALNGLSP